MTWRRITTRRPAGRAGLLNPARANMPTVPLGPARQTAYSYRISGLGLKPWAGQPGSGGGLKCRYRATSVKPIRR